METLSTVVIMFAITIVLSGCGANAEEKQLEKFIAAYVGKIRPVAKEANLAYWDAATTGNSEDYDKVSKLELRIRLIYSNPEEFASQLHHHIVGDVLKLESDAEVGYVDQNKVGDYLRKKVFEPGALYRWDNMIEQATGERLTPKYFVAQFVK